MPLLIKSVGGKRSCEVMSSKRISRQEIIEAFKGLTLKLEVKILDIVDTNTDTALNDGTINKFDEAKVISNAASPTGVVNENKSVKNDQLADIDKPVKVEKPSTSVPKVKIEHPVHISQPAKVDSRPVAVEPVLKQRSPLGGGDGLPRTSPFIKAEEIVQERAASITKKIVKKPQPVSYIVRGQMKVGSKINSCCIASNGNGEAFVSYDSGKLLDITHAIEDLTDEIERLPEVESPKVGDIILGKSVEDDKWYRAVIESVKDIYIDVFFFDWGLRETLSARRIRYLTQPDLGLSASPACAVKVNFSDSSEIPKEEVELGEMPYPMYINSYNDETETYDVTVLRE